MRLVGLTMGVVFAGLSLAGCVVAPDGSTDAAEGHESVAEVSEALVSVKNSCVCIGVNEGGGCGNGAVGGDNGNVKTGLSTATVIASYGPDRVGATRTGWACRPEGTNSCVCIGFNEGGGCGNGAVGGDNGNVKTGLSTATVIASYGPDRTGTKRTGWKCRLSGI